MIYDLKKSNPPPILREMVLDPRDMINPEPEHQDAYNGFGARERRVNSKAQSLPKQDDQMSQSLQLDIAFLPPKKDDFAKNKPVRPMMKPKGSGMRQNTSNVNSKATLESRSQARTPPRTPQRQPISNIPFGRYYDESNVVVKRVLQKSNGDVVELPRDGSY